MNPEALKQIIQQGEGVQVEFKAAGFEIPRNVYESVCAMLNRQGGHLILGVNNDGELTGVIEDCVADMKSAFVSSVNNIAQLNPKYYLNIHSVVIDGHTVLYAYIPESSQVHSYLGKVYDRNEDGDFDISNNPDLVRQLHLKKQGSFSENTLYPAICLTDLRGDLIQRCRILAHNNKPGHHWMELDDMGMLRSANLWKKDWKTGDEGYTLAAALLLGKDEVIQQILPHYKTDAILKRENTERYDDREIVRTNLIESYDKLMAFVAKHLPDKFQMEGDQRISIRDKIFREVIANTLIHREFTNEYPARLLISGSEVFIDNWNRPHGSGKLRLDSYSPFPKNPVIAAFFREIGRAEELGSGYRNSQRFTRLYSNGNEAEFIEGDVFRTVIPLIEKADRATEGAVDGAVDGAIEGAIDGATDRATDRAIDRAIDRANKETKQNLSVLLKAIFLDEGRRNPDYREITKIGSESTMKRYLDRLREVGFIEFKGTAAQTGGYFITEKLRKMISGNPAD